MIISVIIYAFTKQYYDTRVPIKKYKMISGKFGKTDSLNLILGSSHSFFGIDSKLIEGSWFNLASTSQSFMEDFAIIQFCEQKKLHLKGIILPISYFSNWHYLYKTPIGGEQLRVFDYTYAYNIKYPMTPNVKSRLTLISEITKTIFHNSEGGEFDTRGNLIANCNNEIAKISNVKNTFDRHNLNSDFTKINPYIDSISQYCRDNNVSLYFVIMPFTKSYRDLINKTPFDQLLDTIKIKYAKYNCVMIDDRDLFNINEENVMFRDADHLSTCGQKIFSSKLNAQIKTISSTTNYAH